MTNAIECAGLKRTFGRNKFVAVDGLDLSVPEGNVFCLLGPNGAGKTTTIRILSTLLSPSSGDVKVLGYDIKKETKKIRKKIGLILGGDKGLYGRLSAKENLRYFAALNHIPGRIATKRVNEVLHTVGLEQSQDRPVEQYSRGMKQRLHVARGILTDPDLIFMDEPTIGLDPEGAQELRQLVPQLVDKGKTILLTTHYMFEADELSDKIAVINKGQLTAMGTPTEIKQKFSKIDVYDVTLNQLNSQANERLRRFPNILRCISNTEGPIQHLTLHTTPGFKIDETFHAILARETVQSILQRDPTLEEAYLSILKN